MESRIATVIGATGLIGTHLLDLLIEDDFFTTIRVLVRRPVTISHPKVDVKLIAFEDEESFKIGIDGSDAVFCAVGTTQKKVKGNKAAYRKIDFDIPTHAARYCAETGCQSFLLVSSVGANPSSNNFYLRIKGETENEVLKHDIPSIYIFRPSMLLGNRKENRSVEKIGQVIMKTISPLLISSLKKYKPIEANDVAKAMIKASKRSSKENIIFEFNEMLSLLRKHY